MPGLTAARTKLITSTKNPVTGKFHGLGTDKAKAEKIAATANQRIAAAETDYFLKQIDEKPAANKTRGISLKGWVVRYEKVQRTRVSNGELSEGRFKEKMRMANLLAERLGNHPLRSLEVRDFSLLLEEWLDKGQASTALNNRVVWIDLYREAQHAGEVPPGWNPPEATRKPIPKVSRARLSIEDWKAIFSVAPEGHYIRNAMLLALVAGQRREDIVRMKFSDVWDDHLHVIQGKTGMRLALPLSLYSEAVGMTLREVIAGCRDRIVSPYLIHSQLQKKGQPMSKDNLSDYFAEARDKAGIKPPEGKTPTTFHEQRSLAERLYRAQGIDTKTLLGHKVQATTDKYNDTRGQEWIKLVI